jgi:hypothetical protein
VTPEQFERDYAARSGVTLEWLREHRAVRPCSCGEPDCQGWQSVSHEAAGEMCATCGHLREWDSSVETTYKGMDEDGFAWYSFDLRAWLKPCPVCGEEA